MTTTEAPVPTRDDPLEGLRIIDGDAHFTEAPDVWSARVPASFRDRVPVMKTVDGKSAWYLHDDVWSTIGGNTIARGAEKKLGTHVVQPFDRVDASAWSVKDRVALLDAAGVYAQILYPNGV